LPFYIIYITSARSNKIQGFYIYNDAHGANIEPKIEEISKKAKESKQIGQKNLKIRTRKKT